VALAIVADRGSEELLRRLSDPVWFQAFGCVLGFDWHSSGVTTTVCGALKEGLKGLDHESGVVVAGGKGRTSRRTPSEIELACERTGSDPTPLVAASRLSAKVDSSAVQDGFQVYHHSFLFTREGGAWAVIQQGMDEQTGMARRASVRDPVSYAFAHGGKDGTPFPVDRETYDATIESLRTLSEAKAGRTERQAALKRLAGIS
jgi:uncharacterized protein